LHSDASRRWQDGKAKGKTGKTVEEPEHQSMVEIYDGVLHLEVAKTFADVEHNRTLARRNRVMSGDSADAPVSGQDLAAANSPRNQPSPSSPKDQDSHEEFMRLAIRAAKTGVRDHRSKDREPFGAVIVKNGHVIAEAHNCVIENRDATATAEICAIRLATARLGTHNLEGCTLYSTTHPDLMSLGAILWARISKVYCGVTQQLAAQSGFEEGLSHIRELVEVEAGIPSANVIRNIAAGECEAVFQEWSSRNGIIY
jgi:guanine deaminase